MSSIFFMWRNCVIVPSSPDFFFGLSNFSVFKLIIEGALLISFGENESCDWNSLFPAVLSKFPVVDNLFVKDFWKESSERFNDLWLNWLLLNVTIDGFFKIGLWGNFVTVRFSNSWLFRLFLLSASVDYWEAVWIVLVVFLW